ncbi:MAG: hypothetical protein ACYTF7_02580 [Planctomycetota bacterium]|jgi:hypothetical protein
MRSTELLSMSLIGLIAIAAPTSSALSSQNEKAHSPESVFLSRPSSSNDELVGFGFFSHLQPGARRDYIHADDVTLENTHALTAFRWWGLMDGTISNPETGERTRAEELDSLENISAFTLRIYTSNEDGSPSDVIVLEHSEPLEACAPEATGRVGIGRDHASPCPEHVFSMTLPEALTLEAGVKYHVAIAATLVDPHGMNWQWSDCDTVDGYTYTYSYKQSRWGGLQDTDSAMELIGHPLP